MSLNHVLRLGVLPLFIEGRWILHLLFIGIPELPLYRLLRHHSFFRLNSRGILVCIFDLIVFVLVRRVYEFCLPGLGEVVMIQFWFFGLLKSILRVPHFMAHDDTAPALVNMLFFDLNLLAPSPIHESWVGALVVNWPPEESILIANGLAHVLKRDEGRLVTYGFGLVVLLVLWILDLQLFKLLVFVVHWLE